MVIFLFFVSFLNLVNQYVGIFANLAEWMTHQTWWSVIYFTWLSMYAGVTPLWIGITGVFLQLFCELGYWRRVNVQEMCEFM